jgi:SAM-dependent methyltransferase
MSSTIETTISEYYEKRVQEHGATPRGVDWNSVESQNLRFEQLQRVLDEAPKCPTLLDYGCGWGALCGFLQKNRSEPVQYTGYDIAPTMLAHAQKLFPSEATWIAALPEKPSYDYLIASGLFNVRQHHSDAEWLEFVFSELGKFNRITTRGFAFNVLTKYSDAPRMRDYLYYADPAILFDHCKRNFSKRVALLHDYPLYEFTIIVRKD